MKNKPWAAMLPEPVEVRWQRRRGVRKIHVVAVLGALLAAVCLLAVFSGLGRAIGPAKPQPQLIASIDLRLGNTLLASEHGKAQALADIEGGLLQFQTFTAEAAQTVAETARDRRLKQRFGVTWLRKSGTPTPVSEAFVAGYNEAVRAEIERRHGADALGTLLADDRRL